jgi:hypothetical protein
MICTVKVTALTVTPIGHGPEILGGAWLQMRSQARVPRQDSR